MDETAPVAIEGRENMIHFRRLCIKQGMEREFIFNMRMTNKAPSCFVLAKQDMGMPIHSNRGREGKLEVYFSFCNLYGFMTKPEMR